MGIEKQCIESYKFAEAKCDWGTILALHVQEVLGLLHKHFMSGSPALTVYSITGMILQPLS